MHINWEAHEGCALRQRSGQASFLGASFPPEVYAGAKAAAAALPAGETSLGAERLRGIAQSHRDWLADDGGRSRLRASRMAARLVVQASAP